MAATPCRARARSLGGADELAEERRGPGRPRLELRVELAGDEPRVVGELDDLDEPALLERPRDDEPRVDDLLAVVVVHLVAVAVPLVDDRLAVGLVGAGPLVDLDRLRAEAHRAAEVLDLLLLREQVDHRVRRLRVHLRRVRALEPDHVARELGDGDVHAEADAEVRDRALARDAAGEDLALPAARAEAAGDEDAVDLSRARAAPPRATSPRRPPSGRGRGSRGGCRRASAPRARRGRRRGASRTCRRGRS